MSRVFRGIFTRRPRRCSATGAAACPMAPSAGGALKALIPPSLSMILYCVVARTYIFDVFIAAVIPALITIAANLIAIAVMTRLDPAIAPLSERVSRQDKLTAVRRAAPAALLIAIIFAGLYSGVFTVNEAASVAAVVSFAFALMRGTITSGNLVASLRETALIAGMIYFVLIGSSIFTYFISLAKIPEQLIAFPWSCESAAGRHRRADALRL